MAATPCIRHHVWMAYCDDCTDWHLNRQLARRRHPCAGVPTRPAVRPLAH
jgi:hypothetical protein